MYEVEPLVRVIGPINFSPRSEPDIVAEALMELSIESEVEVSIV
jgi:hypothetical protein